jgi:hypothetical protein
LDVGTLSERYEEGAALNFEDSPVPPPNGTLGERINEERRSSSLSVALPSLYRSLGVPRSRKADQ